MAEVKIDGHAAILVERAVNRLCACDYRGSLLERLRLLALYAFFE